MKKMKRDLPNEVESIDPVTDEDGEEIIFEPPNYEYPEIITGGDIVAEPREKYYVNGVNVAVLNERIQYMDGNGKLITGSLKDYTKQKVREQFQSLDAFLNKWNQADKKQAIIEELTEQGIVFENLKALAELEQEIYREVA